MISAFSTSICQVIRVLFHCSYIFRGRLPLTLKHGKPDHKATHVRTSCFWLLEYKILLHIDDGKFENELLISPGDLEFSTDLQYAHSNPVSQTWWTNFFWCANFPVQVCWMSNYISAMLPFNVKIFLLVGHALQNCKINEFFYFYGALQATENCFLWLSSHDISIHRKSWVPYRRLIRIDLATCKENQKEQFKCKFLHQGQNLIMGLVLFNMNLN